MQQPVNNWGDGVGQVMKALGGRMMDRNLDKKEGAHRDELSAGLQSVIASMGGGGGYSGAPTLSSMNTPAAPQGGPAAPAATGVSPELQQVMATLPQDWTVSSTYRTPEHNKEVGGVPNSWHTKGRAADYPTAGLTGDEIAQREQQLKAAGFDMVLNEGDHLHAAITGGGGGDTMVGGDNLSAPAGGYGGGSSGPNYEVISRLSEMISDPYLSEGQRAVAQAIIGQQLKSGDAGMTEYQRESLALDRQRLEQGTREGPKYYGNTQWAERPNEQTGEMELAPYQIGTDGSVNWIDLGGATPMPNTRSADLGTSIAAVGPGGQVVGDPLTKDVAGAAAQGVVGQSVGAAAAGLPAQSEALTRIESVATEILNDPGLEHVLGPMDSRMPAFTQDRADTQAKIDRFLGQTFPMAMDSLRGLGPASEREGLAAQAAINEALAHIRRGFEIAQQKAASVGTPAASPAPAMPQFPGAPPVGSVLEGHRYKGGDPNQMTSWEPAGG
jgi:hypothetical protein